MTTWSKENLCKFIDLYKSCECLWKVKSKHYNDKVAKFYAYGKLVDFVKYFEPLADYELVKKKINALRTCFRKELRKVEDSKASGVEDVYIPKLWYYQNLVFLSEQETNRPTPTVSDLQTYSQYNERLDGSESSFPDDDCFYEDDLLHTPVPVSLTIPSTSTSAKRSKPSKRMAEGDGEDLGFALSRNDRFSVPREDEHDVFAKTVAFKMRKLSPDQSLYAEKIISDVLFEARFGNLSRSSYVVTGNYANNNNSNSDTELKPRHNSYHPTQHTLTPTH